MRAVQTGFFVLTSGLALPLAAAAPDAGVFFRDPAMLDAGMSPSGRYAGLLMKSDSGRAMLAALDVETMQAAPVAGFVNADIAYAAWLSDRRLAIVMNNVDKGGAVSVPGIYAIDRDGGSLATVAESMPKQQSFAEMPSFTMLGSKHSNGELRSALGPDEMFVQVNYDKRLTLGRLNTRSGAVKELRGPQDTPDSLREFSPMQRSDRTIASLVDQKGELRLVHAFYAGRHQLYHVKGNGNWGVLKSFEAAADDGVLPQLFLNDKLYVRARNGQDTASVYRYDIAHDTLSEDALISAPGYDADGRFIVAGNRILGYRMQAETRTTVWYDARMRAAQQSADRMLPNTVNTLSRGEKSATPYVLIEAESDRVPRSYYLLNTESGRLTLLGAAYAAIQPKDMSVRSQVRYQAPDGREVRAYVTVPQGEEKKPRPMVVLIAPEPWARVPADSWQATVQFLAAQGYVVLQPEPRGTYGYGDAYFKAGWKQWGGAVQEDIAAGARWAVAQGLADPQRICVAGTKYGGYAALLALAKQPDLFKCGVSWSAIADPKLMFERRWKGMGEVPLEVPMERMVERDAPSLLAGGVRIRQPVLLAHGEEDEIAPISYARQLAAVLRAGNPASEFVSYSQQDWQSPREANRIDFWNRAAGFLARHIGPR